MRKKYSSTLTWAILTFNKNYCQPSQPKGQGDCPRWWIMTLRGSLHPPSSGNTGLLTKHFQGWWIIASAGPWWGAVLTIHWKSLITWSSLSCLCWYTSEMLTVPMQIKSNTILCFRPLGLVMGCSASSHSRPQSKTGGRTCTRSSISRRWGVKQPIQWIWGSVRLTSRFWPGTKKCKFWGIIF